MTPSLTRITRIGNSRGIRLPADTLRRYQIGETVILENRIEGILIRPAGPAIPKLSWAETARAMSAEKESWTDWEQTAPDGLENLPWASSQPAIVREKRAHYRSAGGKKRK